MATVPGYIYISDFHGQGGNPGLGANIDGLGFSDLVYALDREVMRITPDNGTTGAPTGTHSPWYDGAAGTTLYTIGSSTTTTITVSPSPGWTVNQWANRLCSVRNTAPIPGVGYASRFAVVSNTEDTLTFAALGGAPTVGATFFLGTGRFTDYHPAGGFVHPSEIAGGSRRGGSSWQTAGLGVGPDATMVRQIVDRLHPDAPYCYIFKWCGVETVNYGWADSPNDAARANFLAELVRVNAAAAADGNTIEWRAAIVDLSMTDLEEAVGGDVLVALNYNDRLIQMLEWLRGPAVADNPDLQFVLVNHDPQLWDVASVLACEFFRSVHRVVAYETPGTAIVELRGLPLGVGTDTPATERKYYSLAGYLEYGRRIVDAIERLSLPSAGGMQGGFPVYLMIGDSITTGEVPTAWTENSNSEEISGPDTASLLRPENQMIWSGATHVGEVYEPHTNSNTLASVNAQAGPDLSILAELGHIHPDGFIVLKVGSSSSGLASGGTYTDGQAGRWGSGYDENYTVLVDEFARLVQWVNNTLGRQADVRGCIVSLGHNDQALGGGQEFADALQPFCNDLWRDFGTRTSGRKFPIIWRRPQADAANVIDAEVEIVRDALLAMQNLEAQFRYIDVDDLERDHDDDLHETPESAVTHGRRAFAAMQRIAI